jgi:hypothetical protein
MVVINMDEDSALAVAFLTLFVGCPAVCLMMYLCRSARSEIEEPLISAV